MNGDEDSELRPLRDRVEPRDARAAPDPSRRRSAGRTARVRHVVDRPVRPHRRQGPHRAPCDADAKTRRVPGGVRERSGDGDDRWRASGRSSSGRTSASAETTICRAASTCAGLDRTIRLHAAARLLVENEAKAPPTWRDDPLWQAIDRLATTESPFSFLGDVFIESAAALDERGQPGSDPEEHGPHEDATKK